MTTEANPDPNPPNAGGSAGDGKPNDVKALEAKNAELISRLKKSDARAKELESKVAEIEPLKGKLEKLTEIAMALGAPDPNAQDPEKVKAQLEVEARAKRERSEKVKDALTMALLGTGRKFTPDAVRLIHRGAEDHPAIGFDDTGNVTGVEPYLESVFGLFGGEPAGDKKTSPPPPGKPGSGGSQPVDQKFANVKTFADLSAMGVAAVTEFFEKYPEKYGALKAAHNQSARSPQRVVPPTAYRSA